MTKTKKLAFCGVLTALALGLSYAERFFPLQLIFPLPGIKLGLANVVTLVALCLLGKSYAFSVLTARCLLGAVFGNLAGLVFSLAGGLLALLVMCFAVKIKGLSLYGASVLGAAAHNIGQILVAMVVMGSVYVAAYLPWLLMVSVLTGLLTGSLTAGVLRLLPGEVRK